MDYTPQAIEKRSQHTYVISYKTINNNTHGLHILKQTIVASAVTSPGRI